MQTKNKGKPAHHIALVVCEPSLVSILGQIVTESRDHCHVLFVRDVDDSDSVFVEGKADFTALVLFIRSFIDDALLKILNHEKHKKIQQLVQLV